MAVKKKVSPKKQISPKKKVSPKKKANPPQKTSPVRNRPTTEGAVNATHETSVLDSATPFTLPQPERVEGWGMNCYSLSPVMRPTSEEEIAAILSYANETGTKIAFRGGGCSYGDPAINSEGIVVDLSNYNRILSFDEETGIIHIEAGVTIQQLWEYGIERGFWPPVVSGTMYPTIGGALSMNIHGKNNFVAGTLGEYVKDFTFLSGSGKKFTCSPKENSDIYYSAISGFGMLGCFLEVRLKMKRIYSGKMKVWPVVTRNFQEMFDYFETEYDKSDYLVGWLDAFGSGKNLGRGLIHKSINLPAGEDPDYPENCKLENQNLPTRFMGIIPKSWMWIFMKPFSFSLGMRLVNYGKYLSGFLNNNKPYLQGHAEYSFLLDYVPNWKFMYKPGYMIQYQSFIPKQNAQRAFEEMFVLCQKRGIVTWLAVFKKHKPDPFLLTHAVDGYSMAMDFPVSDRTREKVWAMAHELDEIVLKYGGRFYFAKDATLRPGTADRFFPLENLAQFRKLKAKLDPNGILSSNLYRRIFPKG